MRQLYNFVEKMEQRDDRRLRERATQYADKLIVDIPSDHPLRATLWELHLCDYYYQQGCRDEDLIAALDSLTAQLEEMSLGAPELDD